MYKWIDDNDFFQKVLWGLVEESGVQCVNCDRTVHKRCYDLGVDRCINNLHPNKKNKDTTFELPHRYHLHYTEPNVCKTSIVLQI
mgnify:CR=1 FL=1